MWCVVASSVTLHEAPARLSHVPDTPTRGRMDNSCDNCGNFNEAKRLSKPAASRHRGGA